MAAKNTTNEDIYDDYSTQRFPKDKRDPMWKVLMVQIGGFVALSQFMLGAELGYGMNFRDAVLSTILGSVILQFISFGLGLAGQREGLPTSLLSKWAGFGTIGSAIVGLTFAISLIGWFGIQNSVFAQGVVEIMHSITHGNISYQLVATITGLLVTFSVIFGFKGLSWTTNISIPAFIVVMGVATYNMLKGNDLHHLIAMAAPGAAMGMGAGITMVTGNFIVGAIIMPDITRRTKNGRDVFWVCVIGTIVGELGVNVIGVLMAHAIGSKEIMPIIYQLTGALGIALIVLSSVKVNDMNLYSASLNVVNFFRQVFSVNLNRSVMTVITGILGTILSVVGLIDKFQGFLTILGVVFPPIAAIMFVDYWILKTDRQKLDDSRAKGELPQTSSKLPLMTVIAWVAGILVGQFVTWGVQSLNVLISSGVVYYLGSLLVRKVDQRRLRDREIEE
ncbi:purine-cytosine permease family protein [Lactobacillus sp.]|uniref:purine-cytosine permease family protein n=1 Tax=Lactobacillus sp. TaxID=1591 RepID=UPI00258A650E|nr:cytosine permease [Lactobacillus sp.]MCO6529765.1 cytosine permease [Lactobacillus sp.]